MLPLENSLALVAFAILTGLALGTLGAGGAILALPAFKYAAHLPQREASATSLLVVGSAALIGGLMTLRRCQRDPEEARPDFKVALPFLISGLVGSWGGATVSKFVPELALKLLFGTVVLAAAEGMYLRAMASSSMREPRDAPVWMTPLLGGGVGMLTGLVGVGGGFLIVPVLTTVGKLSLKRASATSVWVIAGNAAAALVGYVGQVHIGWGLAGGFLCVAVLGMSLGQWLSRQVNPKKLQLAFAAFLVVIGIVTFFKH